MLIAFSLAVTGISRAQTSDDLEIGEISVPSLRWGVQPLNFEVTNKSEYLKFLTIETEIKFSESYLSPRRTAKSHYPLEPGATISIAPPVNIPGNYGTAKMYVRIYDVIDTLDIILPDQKVFEQPFQIRFHIPDQLTEYYQTRVSFPPMVETSQDFDFEFARLFLLLISEGKTMEEIASLAECDLEYVQSIADRMVSRRYIKYEDGNPKLKFPFISTVEAEEAASAANRFSDQIVDMIKENLPLYDEVLDSMIGAGTLTNDTNFVLHGGRVLHFKYPTISTLLLWYYLGQGFISGGRTTAIFQGTDPCNARIPTYMYAVHGGAYMNGHHFCDISVDGPSMVILCGDVVPEITCPDELPPFRRLSERKDWSYAPEFVYEHFVMDTALVNPSMRALSKGLSSFLETNHNEIGEIAQKYNHNHYGPAIKYWFWNMTASKALDKLVKQGVVERRGNGQYRFEKLDRLW
jgi:hypothetical protein